MGWTSYLEDIEERHNQSHFPPPGRWSPNPEPADSPLGEEPDHSTGSEVGEEEERF